MYTINPILAIDSYKLGHISMYPKNTTKVYCNLTARSFRLIKNMFPDDMPFFDDKAVVFGLSAAIQGIVESFEAEFFNKDHDEIIGVFRETIQPFIGDNSDEDIVLAMSKLHRLGYLPLAFKTLPEGSLVGENIPMMTWYNTHPDFAWLPNYLETFISSETWKLSTTATIARVYKNIFKYYANLTGVDESFCDFQGHDFSSRGLSGIVDATRSASGHLTSFLGTDAITAINFIKKYYKVDDQTLIGASVPATEHSVQCMGGKETELDTYKSLLSKYPKGIVSIVSDTWDYWELLENGTKELKEQILAREPDSMGMAKTVFRPDSGNPIDIICGTDNDYTVKGLTSVDELEDTYKNISASRKGSVHILDENFGSDINEAGFKTLNQKVGLIYGDSITPVRAHNILRKLMDKGYSSANIVFGIGSYTYQFITRDSLGFAIKATHGVIDGEEVQIFKDPKTGASKKSAKGMMRVDKLNNDYILIDSLDSDEGGCLIEIFRDGKFSNLPTFDEIRDRLKKA